MSHAFSFFERYNSYCPILTNFKTDTRWNDRYVLYQNKYVKRLQNYMNSGINKLANVCKKQAKREILFCNKLAPSLLHTPRNFTAWLYFFTKKLVPRTSLILKPLPNKTADRYLDHLFLGRFFFSS